MRFVIYSRDPKGQLFSGVFNDERAGMLGLLAAGHAIIATVVLPKISVRAR